jgi:hypothetical protein
MSLSRRDVGAIIEGVIATAGGVRALARKWGLSAAYISDIRLAKRDPGPVVLRFLGLKKQEQRIVTYHSTRKP